MSPTEIGPAIARLLMLTAGPDTDSNRDQIRDELAIFDTETAVTQLAVAVATATAAKFEHGAAVYLADGADVLAFGMISRAAEHGPDALPGHLDGMPYSHRAAIAIGLLAMWRQACSAAAKHALTTVSIPETVPEDAP